MRTVLFILALLATSCGQIVPNQVRVPVVVSGKVEVIHEFKMCEEGDEECYERMAEFADSFCNAGGVPSNFPWGSK